MQDTPGTIIVKIRTRSRVLGKTPVPVIRARNDIVGAGDGVQEGGAIRAVIVGVGAGDGWGGGLDIFDVVVDGADFGFLGGGGAFEPGAEEVEG